MHGAPLADGVAVDRFIELVGGHPFLVNEGLVVLASRKLDVDGLSAVMADDAPPFGEHRRRLLRRLEASPALRETVRGNLDGQVTREEEAFYMLRSGGLMRGESAVTLRPRCGLYADWLRRQLSTAAG